MITLELTPAEAQALVVVLSQSQFHDYIPIAKAINTLTRQLDELPPTPSMEHAP